MKRLLLLIWLLPVSLLAQTTDTFWLSGTTDVIDNWVSSPDPTDKNGTDVQLLLGLGFGGPYWPTVGFPYLADSIGDFSVGWVLKEARIEMYENGVFIAEVTTDAYYIVKPYKEIYQSYNRWWDNPPSEKTEEWGSAGLNDTGSIWNSTDNGGDDRGGTSQGQVVISGSGWQYLDLDTAWINATVDLDSLVSYVLIDSDGGLVGIHSSEYTTDSSLTIRLRVIMELAVSEPVTWRHRTGQSARRGHTNVDSIWVRHK